MKCVESIKIQIKNPLSPKNKNCLATYLIKKTIRPGSWKVGLSSLFVSSREMRYLLSLYYKTAQVPFHGYFDKRRLEIFSHARIHCKNLCCFKIGLRDK
jgi:hypothetical protein